MPALSCEFRGAVPTLVGLGSCSPRNDAEGSREQARIHAGTQSCSSSQALATSSGFSSPPRCPLSLGSERASRRMDVPVGTGFNSSSMMVASQKAERQWLRDYQAPL
jgi:hypothetical protein